MKKLALLLALVPTTALVAQEWNAEDYYTIGSVETIDVTDLEAAIDPSFPAMNRSVYLVDEDPVDPIDETAVILDKIIAIGDKIWKIIEKNKPVVNTKYQAMSLLPEGANRWEQLETWEAPQAKVFKNLYKNKFGMTVVEFNYRVVFTPGGSVGGKGKYISRATIEPRDLSVAWGYTFNASGEVPSSTNAGTKLAPIAAMELRMDWTIDTVFKHTEESTLFYVRGDGLFKDVSNGSIPANN